MLTDVKGLNMMMTAKWSVERTKEIMKKKPTLVEKTAQFVNGQGDKSKRSLFQTARTVISHSRPEKAKNKPLVECSVGVEKVKTMFDTGADLNVISQDLVERIKKQNPSVKIYRSNTTVKCANGSTEKCMGKVQLNVAIGPVITAHVFDIMPNVFPHLFIGIRSMKKYGIMVNPGKDEIEIQGIRIPFVSKTIGSKCLN